MELKFEELRSYGQDQVLKFHNELSSNQKAQLEADIVDVDWKRLTKIYEKFVMKVVGDTDNKRSKLDCLFIEPLLPSHVEGVIQCNQDTIEKYRELGLRNVGQGRVAALLLAGGQGTRLGIDYPKGMFDVGLPSHKSLYQLQAERILEILNQSTGHKTKIIWYIMTSEATVSQTSNYFESHNHFGLPKEDVVIFEQFTIPSFDLNGKVLLNEKFNLAKSPDGNGGVFEAIHKRGIIDHMIANGVKYLHVFCVDNILVRVCDPVFIGYCISKQVDAGAKVVEKQNPMEAVGIICRVNNKFKVIEYSEITEEIVWRRDESTGKFAFNKANICDHFFDVDFLKEIQNIELPYHVALKKIPHISLESGETIVPVKPNGVKLEKFIFDVFELTNKFAVWEVQREDEFAPLKNSEGSERDNPKTALDAILRCYKLGILSS